MIATKGNVGLGAIIEICPHCGGWQCYEAPGVAPFFIEGDAKKSAIDYASNRMRGRTGEVRVMDAAGNLEHTLTFN